VIPTSLCRTACRRPTPASALRRPLVLKLAAAVRARRWQDDAIDLHPFRLTRSEFVMTTWQTAGSKGKIQRGGQAFRARPQDHGTRRVQPIHARNTPARTHPKPGFAVSSCASLC
jgi:hypothetical protein